MLGHIAWKVFQIYLAWDRINQLDHLVPWTTRNCSTRKNQSCWVVPDYSIICCGCSGWLQLWFFWFFQGHKVENTSWEKPPRRLWLAMRCQRLSKNHETGRFLLFLSQHFLTLLSWIGLLYKCHAWISNWVCSVASCKGNQIFFVLLFWTACSWLFAVYWTMDRWYTRSSTSATPL